MLLNSSYNVVKRKMLQQCNIHHVCMHLLKNRPTERDISYRFVYLRLDRGALNNRGTHLDGEGDKDRDSVIEKVRGKRNDSFFHSATKNEHHLNSPLPLTNATSPKTHKLLSADNFKVPPSCLLSPHEVNGLTCCEMSITLSSIVATSRKGGSQFRA